jgi:hypothetical protein
MSVLTCKEILRKYSKVPSSLILLSSTRRSLNFSFLAGFFLRSWFFFFLKLSLFLSRGMYLFLERQGNNNQLTLIVVKVFVLVQTLV